MNATETQTQRKALRENAALLPLSNAANAAQEKASKEQSTLSSTLKNAPQKGGCPISYLKPSQQLIDSLPHYQLKRPPKSEAYQHPWKTLETTSYLSSSHQVAVLDVMGVWMGKNYAQYGVFFCDVTDQQIREQLPFIPLRTIQATLRELREAGWTEHRNFKIHRAGQVRTKRYIVGTPTEEWIKKHASEASKIAEPQPAANDNSIIVFYTIDPQHNPLPPDHGEEHQKTIEGKEAVPSVKIQSALQQELTNLANASDHRILPESQKKEMVRKELDQARSHYSKLKRQQTTWLQQGIQKALQVVQEQEKNAQLWFSLLMTLGVPVSYRRHFTSNILPRLEKWQFEDVLHDLLFFATVKGSIRDPARWLNKRLSVVSGWVKTTASPLLREGYKDSSRLVTSPPQAEEENSSPATSEEPLVVTRKQVVYVSASPEVRPTLTSAELAERNRKAKAELEAAERRLEAQEIEYERQQALQRQEVLERQQRELQQQEQQRQLATSQTRRILSILKGSGTS
jgi:hypothetical protein